MIHDRNICTKEQGLLILKNNQMMFGNFFLLTLLILWSFPFWLQVKGKQNQLWSGIEETFSDPNNTFLWHESKKQTNMFSSKISTHSNLSLQIMCMCTVSFHCSIDFFVVCVFFFFVCFLLLFFTFVFVCFCVVLFFFTFVLFVCCFVLYFYFSEIQVWNAPKLYFSMLKFCTSWCLKKGGKPANGFSDKLTQHAPDLNLRATSLYFSQHNTIRAQYL